MSFMCSVKLWPAALSSAWKLETAFKTFALFCLRTMKESGSYWTLMCSIISWPQVWKLQQKFNSIKFMGIGKDSVALDAIRDGAFQFFLFIWQVNITSGWLEQNTSIIGISLCNRSLCISKKYPSMECPVWSNSGFAGPLLRLISNFLTMQILSSVTSDYLCGLAFSTSYWPKVHTHVL